MPRVFLLVSILWTALWWFIAWSQVPLLSEYSFFPLWIGYIFSINAACEVLFHDSLLRKSGSAFLLFFVTSIPLWWSFEYLNLFVQNWHYLDRPVSQLHFVLQSSIDFSTVIPAALSTAFLFRHVFARSNVLVRRKFDMNSTLLIVLVVLGVISFPLMVFFPAQAFPLVWVAPFLILDPINYAFKFPSILRSFERGKWLTPASVMIGTLFTGFFWEMWNFYSYPKWFYTIPYVGFWKIFEMPLLGYGGYLFFGLITWSFTVLVFSLFGGARLLKRTALFSE
jgi:hypothetical protein